MVASFPSETDEPLTTTARGPEDKEIHGFVACLNEPHNGSAISGDAVALTSTNGM